MARPRKKTEEEQPQDAVDETTEADAPEAERFALVHRNEKN